MTPLIYTKYGNVPADTLDYKVTWTDNQELSASLTEQDGIPYVSFIKGGTITMIEQYFDKITGECVKQSAHTHLFSGLDLSGVVGQLS